MATSARDLIAKTIGERVRFYRTKRGISQEKLARRMEVSRQTVATTENGSNAPRIETLEKFAQALEVSIWDLWPERPAASSLTSSGDEAEAARPRRT